MRHVMPPQSPTSQTGYSTSRICETLMIPGLPHVTVRSRVDVLCYYVLKWYTLVL